MAKKNDPFDTFRAMTLGNSPKLSEAIAGKPEPEPEQKVEEKPQERVTEPVVTSLPKPKATVKAKTDEKAGKNANCTLVSFNLDKDLKKRLGLLKFESGISYNDLYSEAIELLLKKYKM